MLLMVVVRCQTCCRSNLSIRRHRQRHRCRRRSSLLAAECSTISLIATARPPPPALFVGWGSSFHHEATTARPARHPWQTWGCCQPGLSRHLHLQTRSRRCRSRPAARAFHPSGSAAAAAAVAARLPPFNTRLHHHANSTRCKAAMAMTSTRTSAATQKVRRSASRRLCCPRWALKCKSRVGDDRSKRSTDQWPQMI